MGIFSPAACAPQHPHCESSADSPVHRTVAVLFPAGEWATTPISGAVGPPGCCLRCTISKQRVHAPAVCTVIDAALTLDALIYVALLAPAAAKSRQQQVQKTPSCVRPWRSLLTHPCCTNHCCTRMFDTPLQATYHMPITCSTSYICGQKNPTAHTYNRKVHALINVAAIRLQQLDPCSHVTPL